MERPNDKIFDQHKKDIEQVLDSVGARRSAMVEIIKADMINALALSEAIDEAGILIEYVIQENGADRPFFDGKHIIDDFSRVSKLKTIYAFAKALELDDEALHQVLLAEVDRLWFDPRRMLSAKESKSDKGSLQLELPQEVVGLLRSISKTVGKK